jgi:hypothetical protein
VLHHTSDTAAAHETHTLSHNPNRMGHSHGLCLRLYIHIWLSVTNLLLYIFLILSIHTLWNGAFFKNFPCAEPDARRSCIQAARKRKKARTWKSEWWFWGWKKKWKEQDIVRNQPFEDLDGWVHAVCAVLHCAMLHN